MIRAGRRFACFLAVSFVPLLGAQGPLRFTFTNAAGPHAVGLKVVEQYDYARTYHSAVDQLGKPYSGERARPLQTLVWYPAEKTGKAPMTVGDYATLRVTETDFAKKATADELKELTAVLAPALSDKLWAVRDAAMETGRFPVVIYAPSFSNVSWENVDLCEYLASNGFVVIASPDMGQWTRGMTADLPGVNAQAADISFLIGYAHSLPDTDMSEVGVGGFSWGGISNLFAASRDSRIDALFALDGSMRYFPGLVKQAGVHPENMPIPLLFFTQGEISLEEQEANMPQNEDHSPNVLNTWLHGDLITVHMMGLTHGEFSSTFQRENDFWKHFEPKSDYSRADGVVGYAWVARYTLEFLNAYLKHDAAAMVFLKKAPVEAGVPPHTLAVNFRAASGPPATLDAFRQQLNEKGWDHASEIYAAMQKQDSKFKLDEGSINDWGYGLLTGKHPQEAMTIFKLNVSLYPDSGNVYDSLGEAYMKSGQKDLAIENYKKSLEKNPNNENAKDKLKELETKPPAGN
ncbi:MAG TPA: tetratricopeptide repeat protein [Terracidiphilus sp.]|nr:tetratricopeptide repeat protein [Terracidiphilus sp.]